MSESLIKTARSEMLAKIWRGYDPFGERSAFRGRYDLQGWGSDNPLLVKAIQEVRPSCIAEVGVWKGGSSIAMAREVQRLGLDAVVVSIDTWLGSVEHWQHDSTLNDLRLEAGYPSLYKTFAANVLENGVDDTIVPLPLDSLNAARVFVSQGISPEILHLDAGHDYNSVATDLRTWWAILAVGGILIGDDYHPVADIWVGVRDAFQEFFQTKNIENFGGKCIVRKTC